MRQYIQNDTSTISCTPSFLNYLIAIAFSLPRSSASEQNKKCERYTCLSPANQSMLSRPVSIHIPSTSAFQSPIPTLDTFLPSSMKSLASFGKDLISNKSDLSWIVELPSLSPGHGKVKEVPPVFLIPGLHGSPCEILKSLAMKLMYPAMSIRFVQPFTSISEIAASLVKHVQEKQKMGPYNLVGISWGGVLTLELARQLEAQGHSTRVILIDGAPETTQAAVRCLKNEDKFDLNLVSRLLHIPESKVTNSWSALLADSLKEVPLIMKPLISSALTTLRSCLSELLNYKPTGELLKGEISLIRPSDGNEDDNCGLDQFVKHTVNIHITEGNHFTILENPNTARIINDFIL